MDSILQLINNILIDDILKSSVPILDQPLYEQLLHL